jgi:flavodoxin
MSAFIQWIGGKINIMKAVVVYESHWGNTAAIARAIAEGIGSGARALSTAQASAGAISNADLIVAGTPVLGFRLPPDDILKMIGANSSKDPAPPDLSHPLMRAWFDALPKGKIQ